MKNYLRIKLIDESSNAVASNIKKCQSVISTDRHGDGNLTITVKTTSSMKVLAYKAESLASHHRRPPLHRHTPAINLRRNRAQISATMTQRGAVTRNWTHESFRDSDENVWGNGSEVSPGFQLNSLL